MSRALTIGVEATFLARDGRGMGRVVRNVLSEWQGEVPHRVVLVTRERRHLAELEEHQAEGWECCWHGEAPQLDVCWFPWMRVDWEPRCPAAVAIYDVAPFTEYHEENRHQEADQERLRVAVERADRILTISNFSRVEIHRHLDVAVDRIEVAHLGVDPIFHPKSNPELAGIPAKKIGPDPYILYVGNAEPRKNLVGLLEAFALMGRVPYRLALVCERPKGPSWTDRLRGKRPPLARWAEEVDDRVTWIDRPKDEILAELYRQSRLFVMPSYYEGFGLPLLEAMACGAPVAAARAASLPEVGGDVPHYFRPDDPVDIARALMEALEQEEPDRAAGVARAREFQWSQTALTILETLEDLAGHGISLPAS